MTAAKKWCCNDGKKIIQSFSRAGSPLTSRAGRTIYHVSGRVGSGRVGLSREKRQ